MYKVPVGNHIVVCETLEALNALLDYLDHQEQKSEQKKPLIGSQLPDNPSILDFHVSHVSTDERMELINFMQKINKLHESVIDSEKMKGLLGVESVHGVGPRLLALSKRFERAFHIPMENFLERDAKPGQPTVWRINRHFESKILESF